MFTEIKRHKPSVIYIPNFDAWLASMSELSLRTFHTMLRSIPATDPVLLFATAECRYEELEEVGGRDFFGYTPKNRYEIGRPNQVGSPTMVLSVTSSRFML